MASGRDNRGRFVPGNTVRSETARRSYQTILRECLNDESAKKIIAKAVEQASEGDARAREWLFAHVLPRLHVIEYNDRTEAADFDMTGNPFDQQASREMALLLESCQTIEEVEFVSKLMDRAQANLPTGNPFEDILSRPIDDEAKRMFEAMTPEERRKYEELMEGAAERHRNQPVRLLPRQS